MVVVYAILGCVILENSSQYEAVQGVSSRPSPPMEKQIEKNGYTFIEIPSGMYSVGHTGDFPLEEQPQFFVELANLYVGKTEVTNTVFATYLNDVGYTLQQASSIVGLRGTSMYPTEIVYSNERFRASLGYEDYPVTAVTFLGAQSFCAWIGGRLPMEYEWEIVAAATRKKTQNTLYPWGNEGEKTKANIDGLGVQSVCNYDTNNWGLCDVMGNVWEWTESYFLPYQGHMDVLQTEHMLFRRVLRGGDWFSRWENISLFTRLPMPQDTRGLLDGGIGFRCVVENAL